MKGIFSQLSSSSYSKKINKSLVVYLSFIFLLTEINLQAQSALNFAGGNDDITIGNITLLSFERTDAFSLEAWIKTSATTQMSIISKMFHVTPFTGYELSVTSTGKLLAYLSVSQPSNSLSVTTTGVSVNDGKWHHVAMTYDGSSAFSGLKLYIDGVEQTSMNSGSSPITGSTVTTAPLHIGSRHPAPLAAFFFNGEIDEVRIWGDVRSQTELQDNMNQELGGSESDLLAYYNFNEGVANGNNTSLTQVIDQTGNGNHGTLHNFTKNGTSSNWVEDFRVNYNALHLNGIDDYVECGNDATLAATNIQTMEAWVKFDDLTGFQEILSKSSGFQGIELLLFNNDLHFFCLESSSNHSYILYPSSNLNTNQWYHIAVAWDGSTKESMRLYVDGVSVGTRTDVGDINSNAITEPSNGFRIGTWANATDRFFKGSVDDVRIWSTTRSVSEIQSNRFNDLLGSESGLIAYYDFNQGRAGENNAGITTLVDVTGSSLNGTLTNFALSGSTSNWVIGVDPEINVKQESTNLPSGTGTYDFGELLQNTASGNVTFTIENIGERNLELSSSTRVTISGTNASDFTLVTDASASISPTTSSTFQIQFKPEAVGIREATITINNNDADEGSYTINLTGTGLAGTPVMEISEGGSTITNTTLIDYGTATWGANGLEKTFTISNTGTGDLVLNTFAPVLLTGSEGHFTLTEQPSLTTIPPSGSTDFKIQFTPQSANLETESILILSNVDGFLNPRAITLRGQGQREVLNTPTGFTATALSAQEIELTWTDTSPNETGFILSKSLTGASDSYLSLSILDANTSSFVDNSLIANQRAYYQLQAVSERGESAEVLADALTKNPPQAPEGLLVSTFSQSQIILSWEDTSDNEFGFSIERSQDANGLFVQIAIAGVNVSNYTDNGLTNGTEYYYRVKAINPLEGDSHYSNVSGAITSDVPLPPSGVTLSIAGDNIVINWQDNSDNEEEFRVERFSVLAEIDNFVEIVRLPAESTAFTDTTTNANQLYTYRVRASNEDGISVESNLASIETPFDPNISPPSITPQGLVATSVTESEIALSWNAVTSGIDFTLNNFVRIERATQPEGSFTEIDQIPITENTYQATELDKNVVYYFRIRFANDGGNSPYSELASALTECRLVASVSDDKEDVIASACNGKSVILFAKTNAVNANFQWTRDGLTLANSNQPFYYATSSGKYNCIITSGDCPAETALVPVVVTINNPISVTINQIDNVLEADLTIAEAYQWYKDEDAIEGATEFQYTPTDEGLYYVVATRETCSSTSNFIFVTTTGVHEVISDEIIVYPNPTSEQAKLKWLNDYLGEYVLSVYDLTGRKYSLKTGFKSQLLLEEQIDLSDFQSGVYLLELKGEGFQAIKKVIKE